MTWPSCCVARLATPLAVSWHRPLHHREANGNTALRLVNDTASSRSESPASGGRMQLGKDGRHAFTLLPSMAKVVRSGPVLVNKT